MGSPTLSYVLVTPARNEGRFIEQTIQSVISQTVLPKKWVIVSDGSTDQTDSIVTKYLPDHPWLELLRMPERSDRHFAAKVRCINAGLEKVEELDYDIVGNLDADITFGPDYFQFLLTRFLEDPRLGVAGTPFVEGTVQYDYRFTSIEHVSGACQLFRARCFEEIGGYRPIKGGGIDWVAVTTARMKGWRTRTFVEQVCYHHRPMGTASVSNYRALYKLGMQDYYLGGHPVWQVFRACFQATRKPHLIGGACLLAGYCYALLTRVEKTVPPELVRFHQGEQLRRLRQVFTKVLGAQN